MEKQALEYVLEKARVDDVSITQEQGRKSLGALGLSGDMALARIGTPAVCSCQRNTANICKLHNRQCCNLVQGYYCQHKQN